MSESTTTTEQKPASRNPFAKISNALGFAQKPRWIQDFRIDLDHKNPNHRYSPGDVLRGTVFFTPTKAVRITHITISLYGYVHVYKGFSVPGEGVPKESLHSDPSRLLGIPGVVPLFTPVEETLFGDVKLSPCRGQFQFALRLPSHRLPSSIDFEKGSIQYNLVATITRPNPISPVIRCDPRKFLVHENIDCGRIATPKPRTVSLEAVDKRKRRKKAPSLTVNSDKFGTLVEREELSPRSSISPSLDGSHHSNDNASISNSSSSTELRITNITTNAGSATASSNGSGSGSGKSVAFAPATSAAAASKSKNPAIKTITASAEVLRGAFLPGDSIPVRVQVHHTKHVKSMCGLIVTLYRKTHIETEPLIHQKVRDENGNITLKPITGDVYPKSLTGFGGLSMSNKQTSHTFRMDVAQKTVPLFIDPVTHKADIRMSVKIPTEGVHPTITHVRGDTLDFRYYVEVCLDIQGKLEESRLLPRLTNQAIHGLGKPSTRGSPSVPMSLAAQGQQMIDTQTIRREKPQIVSWVFHVVIGTRDSTRGIKSSSKSDVGQQADLWNGVDPRVQQQSSAQGSEISRASRLDDVQEDTFAEELRNGSRGRSGFAASDTRNHSPVLRENRSSRLPHQLSQHSQSQEHLARIRSYSPSPAPPPPLLFDDTVDEKTRLKQHEARLMPSRPHVDGESGSSTATLPPSAPPAEELDGLDNRRWETEVSVQYRDSGYDSSRSFAPVSKSPMMRRSLTHDGVVPLEHGGEVPLLLVRQASTWSNGAPQQASPATGTDSRNAFSFFDFTEGSSSRMQPPTEDKEELERRRLLAQRSAPDYGESEQEHGQVLEPNVPTVLNDDDHHAAFGEWDPNQEGLPRYEK